MVSKLFHIHQNCLATDILAVGLEKLLYRRGRCRATEPRSGGFSPKCGAGIVDPERCEDNHFVEHRVAKQFGRVKKCSSNTKAGARTKTSLHPSKSLSTRSAKRCDSATRFSRERALETGLRRRHLRKPGRS